MSDYYSDLFSLISERLSNLDRDGFPNDAICTHHGISFLCGDDNIGITDFQGRLLVTIYRGDSKYQKDENGKTLVVGYTKTVHQHKINVVSSAAASPVHETWNGDEGTTGVSICLQRPCPSSLRAAIANYRRLSDVFKMTKDERAKFQLFNDWLNTNET